MRNSAPSGPGVEETIERLEADPPGELEVAVATDRRHLAEGARRRRRPGCIDSTKRHLVGHVATVRLKDESDTFRRDVEASAHARVQVVVAWRPQV